MSKATSLPQANHSQYSSPVEVSNLIVKSKSLPAEVNDLNIELHLPFEAEEKLFYFLLITNTTYNTYSYYDTNKAYITYDTTPNY